MWSCLFTVPAASMVGPNGYIYALDVNPFAISHLSKKIARCGAVNAEALHANAAHTGLPDDHIDLVFFIGAPQVHIIYRILEM